jgi:hypothetical protein
LTTQAGAQFDPDVVRAFLNLSLGRVGWLAGFLGWLGGTAVIRAGANAPKDAPAAGLTAVAIALAGMLGLFNDVAAVASVPAPAPAAVVLAERPARSSAPPTSAPDQLLAPLPPLEVLGQQYTNDEPGAAATTPSAAPAVTSPTTRPPLLPTSPGAVTPASPTTTSTTLPLCNARTGGLLDPVLQVLAPKKPSHNPNCTPPRSG